MSSQQTPDIQSTEPNTLQEDNITLPAQEVDREPTVEEFKTGAGIEKVRALDPDRYIKTTTCWLHKNHARSGIRIAVQLNAADEVVSFKCGSKQISKLCQYTAELIRDRWIAIGDDEEIKDPESTSESIRPAPASAPAPTTHINQYLGHRKQVVTRANRKEPSPIVIPDNVKANEAPQSKPVTTDDMSKFFAQQNEMNQQVHRQLLDIFKEDRNKRTEEATVTAPRFPSRSPPMRGVRARGRNRNAGPTRGYGRRNTFRGPSAQFYRNTPRVYNTHRGHGYDQRNHSMTIGDPRTTTPSNTVLVPYMVPNMYGMPQQAATYQYASPAPAAAQNPISAANVPQWPQNMTQWPQATNPADGMYPQSQTYGQYYR